jgi:hypothetical protein
MQVIQFFQSGFSLSAHVAFEHLYVGSIIMQFIMFPTYVVYVLSSTYSIYL